MKKIFIISLLNLALSNAFAEVKPEGTVLVNVCGQPSKQIEVCLAKSKLSADKNIVVLKYSNQKNPYFLLADRKNLVPEGMVGVAKFSYITSLFQKQGNYVVEKKVEIKTSRVVYPNAPMKAELFINGSQVGSEFELEPMFHTQ